MRAASPVGPVTVMTFPRAWMLASNEDSIRRRNSSAGPEEGHGVDARRHGEGVRHRFVGHMSVDSIGHPGGQPNSRPASTWAWQWKTVCCASAPVLNTSR